MAYLESTVINRELISDFFLRFSRFEFALKVTGYATGSESRVDPDWTRFAKDIQEIFDWNRDPALVEACELYIYTPPQKQVLVNGELAWSTTLPGQWSEHSVAFLLELVRRVRNNLFHGGKYNGQFHEETARNEALLAGGLRILQECLQASDEVRKAYEEAAI